MTEIASKSQLRMSFLRVALVTVPAVLLLGILSGQLAGSGDGNRWFEALEKPAPMPPGWLFGLVWPILYVLLGLVLAMLIHARGAAGRPRVLALYGVGLALNLAWSPVFFAWHMVDVAMSIVAAMAVVTAALVPLAWRIRPLGGFLLLPYLGWLVFAAALNFEILRLNPDAGEVAPEPSGTDIVL